MNVVMIGSGYVGLVSGACFAEFGANVTCIDVDQKKIDALNAGKIPIYEPGLEEMVQTNVAAGRLRFTESTQEGVENSDVVFIAVTAAFIATRRDSSALKAASALAPRQTLVLPSGVTVEVPRRPLRILPASTGLLDWVAPLIDPARLAAIPDLTEEYALVVRAPLFACCRLTPCSNGCGAVVLLQHNPFVIAV